MSELELEEKVEEIKKPVQKRTRKVRKRVVIEEDVVEKQDPKQYEEVTFIFWNDEQKGIPVEYSWVDKWIRPGQCKGTFYDGKQYTLPRIVYEYYRDQCSMPKYANVEQEIVPGQFAKASKEIGRIYRFRLDVVR